MGMSAEEKACHMKEGLCFYCHEKGHSALKCPKKQRTMQVATVSAGTETEAMTLAPLQEPIRVEGTAETMDFTNGK
jgi:hypothetical protein